jgi:hypothetical protein
MCAEAVPWRCHRSLIVNALTVRGIRVEDIMSMKHSQIHSLTPFARVQEGKKAASLTLQRGHEDEGVGRLGGSICRV